MDVIVQTVQVEQTKNEKYQKVDQRGERLYSMGFERCPELVGKTIRVTVEVID